VPDVIISPTGVQGPRGNAVLSGARAPQTSDGIDGDYWVDTTQYPTSALLYGPKASNTWPGSGITFGGGAVGALLAANNLSDLQDKPTARTNLGLGTAATHAAGDFDGAGAAAAAYTSAVSYTDAQIGGEVSRANGAYQPLQPGVFDVTKAPYSAKGDGLVVTDGAITTGTAILTSASAPFANVIAGMLVMVKGAGTFGVTTHVTTVASKQSNGQITLAANAPTTVTGALVLIATDDTGAFQAAINAATAYAVLHGAAKVLIPAPAGRFYGIGGPLVSGGATKGNAQLTLPVVATSGNKAVLTIEGPGDGAAVQHWEQLVPQMSGATLVSFGVFASSSAQIASINAAGNACVLGGPSQPGGYGVAPGVYSNMHLVLRNMSILTTHSANGLTYSAADLSGVANAAIENMAYGTTGTVAGGDYSSPGSFAFGLVPGLLLPADGNNDLVTVRNLTCHGGYTYGIFATEHFDGNNIRILYDWAAFCPVGTYYGSVGSTHAIVATLLSIESCSYLVYIIGGGSGGIGPFLHLRIDTETGLPRFGDNNSGFASSTARGEVVLTGLYTASSLTLDAPIGYDIIDGQRSYPSLAVSANYTVSTLDELVTVDASGAGRTITLPTAVGRNKRIIVTKTDSSGNAVTVATTGGQTINGVATKSLATQWATAEFVPAAGNWIAR